MPGNWYPTIEFIQGLLDEKKNAPLLIDKERLEKRRRLHAGITTSKTRKKKGKLSTKETP